MEDFPANTSQNRVPFEIGDRSSLASSDRKSVDSIEATEPTVVATGAPFYINVNWPVTGNWEKPTEEVKNVTSISLYRVSRSSNWIYTYILEFVSELTYNFTFRDGEGDEYGTNTYLSGIHTVRYNSSNPTIVYVSGK